MHDVILSLDDNIIKKLQAKYGTSLKLEFLINEILNKDLDYSDMYEKLSTTIDTLVKSVNRSIKHSDVLLNTSSKFFQEISPSKTIKNEDVVVEVHNIKSGVEQVQIVNEYSTSTTPTNMLLDTNKKLDSGSAKALADFRNKHPKPNSIPTNHKLGQ